MDRVRRQFTTTLFITAFLSAYAVAQERNIMLELNQGLAQLQQTAGNDPSVKGALDTLAHEVPEVSHTLRQLAANTAAENIEQARYGLYREFFVNTKTLSATEVERLLGTLRANALVQSAQVRVLDEVRAPDPSHAIAVKRNAIPARPLYLLDPTPKAGYLLGGINSDAVRDLPGGRGEYARVIIASDSYWDRNHVNLPKQSFHAMRPPQRLGCGLYWAVGNSGTQAAGIIADKDLGIVPAAKLTATPSSWMGGMYFEDINAVGLKRGDVVVIDAQTSANSQYFYPRNVCRGGTVCSLPQALAVGDGNIKTGFLREIEYLTEIKGVHVVINAGGGTGKLSDSWQSLVPGGYLPTDLDNGSFQRNFDRTRNDDGSILVGSLNPVTGTAVGANYGKRIDLSTWATKIQAAGYQAGTQNLYTRYDDENPLAYKFSAWIMAGVVAQIQSIAFALGLGPVPPKIMRQLLVDTGHALAHATPGIERGKQPDVKAAVDKMLSAYANGFPPEPAGPTIKRIEGVGFWAGDRGSSYGGARSNTTETYTPILHPNAKGVTFDWKVAAPLIIRSVDPATGELKVDVPARVGAYWHQPEPPTTSVTLTTRDNQGLTDSLSRSSSIVGLYTDDQTLAASWNVPDTLIAGQPASFTVTPKALASGYQIRWIAPALFAGIQERIGSDAPYTITVIAPRLSEDQHVKVEVGGTISTGGAPSNGQGFFLSKSVLVRATPQSAQPLRGTLTTPASVASGSQVLFSSDVQDVNGGGLSYLWILPNGFTGATNRSTFTGFAPTVSQNTTGPVQLLISDTHRQQLRLSKAVTVTRAPPPEVPGEGQCAPPWEAAKVYAAAGVKVSYNGHNYAVAHWTQNQPPDANFVLTGSAKPWRRLVTCSP